MLYQKQVNKLKTNKNKAMIKKLLLSLIIVPFLGISVALCQCSPDPQYTSPGVNPDSATGLPHAIAGVNYSTTMTVNVPEDNSY